MGTILRDLFEQHRRRLYLAARQILAAHSESQVALANALQRIADRGFAGPDDQFLHFADRVLHDVIDEQRRAGSRFPASDDLRRQLFESAEPYVENLDERAIRFRELVERLPSNERDLLREHYVARAIAPKSGRTDGRPMARELTAIYDSLSRSLFGPPDDRIRASDIGRLTLQVAHGDGGSDAQLVLETLLLGDARTQAAYHRFIATVAELDWLLATPAMPEISFPKRRITRSELFITVTFVTALIAVLLVVVYAIWERWGGQ